MQKSWSKLQDDKLKTTPTCSVLSKLGLDFLDPQPDMTGIKTNEAETCNQHEADDGAGTPVKDSFFVTLFP